MKTKIKLFLFFLIISTNLYSSYHPEDIKNALEKNDYTTSYKLSQTICGQGVPEGCFYLALHYHEALGVTQNLNQAIYLYSRACQYGNSYKACYNLGNIYLDGKGIEKDTQKAIELYTKACQAGLKEACSTLDKINKDTSKVTVQNKSIEQKKVMPLNRSDEKLFLKILTNYRDEYIRTNNDVKRQILKEKRSDDLRLLFRNTSVDSWVGTIKSIKIISFGNAELVVEIAPKIYLAATMDLDSDYAVILKNSKLYKIVSTLEIGQKISFSGELIHDYTHYTENFFRLTKTIDSMLEPIFLFKFTSLEVISTEQQVDKDIISDDTLNTKLKQAEQALIKEKEDISQYDKAFAIKVKKIIASNWDKTPDTFDGNTAKVRIKISDQGVFSHKIVSLSYNNEFNTKLKQFLKNMEKQEFPKYEKGTFFETQIEFKDVLK